MLDRLRKSIYLSIMNKLPTAKKVQIINLLVEGMSLRATSRIADVSINTGACATIIRGAESGRLHDH